MDGYLCLACDWPTGRPVAQMTEPWLRLTEDCPPLLHLKPVISMCYSETCNDTLLSLI